MTTNQSFGSVLRGIQEARINQFKRTWEPMDESSNGSGIGAAIAKKNAAALNAKSSTAVPPAVPPAVPSTSDALSRNLADPEAPSATSASDVAPMVSQSKPTDSSQMGRGIPRPNSVGTNPTGVPSSTQNPKTSIGANPTGVPSSTQHPAAPPLAVPPPKPIPRPAATVSKVPTPIAAAPAAPAAAAPSSVPMQRTIVRGRQMSTVQDSVNIDQEEITRTISEEELLDMFITFCEENGYDLSEGAVMDAWKTAAKSVGAALGTTGSAVKQSAIDTGKKLIGMIGTGKALPTPDKTDIKKDDEPKGDTLDLDTLKKKALPTPDKTDIKKDDEPKGDTLDLGTLKKSDNISSAQATVDAAAAHRSSIKPKKLNRVAGSKRADISKLKEDVMEETTQSRYIASFLELQNIKGENMFEAAKTLAKKDVNKTSSGYEINHAQYTDAVNHALAHHSSEKGIQISDEDRWHHISSGNRKPSAGETRIHNIPALDKNGNQHVVHMQIYNRGGSGNKPYELNTYSSKMPNKNVKEEAEEIEERKTTKDKLDTHFDFRNLKKPVKEEVEEIEEVSVGKLQNYVKDAKSVLSRPALSSKKTLDKTSKGLSTALDKLDGPKGTARIPANEDVEVTFSEEELAYFASVMKN